MTEDEAKRKWCPASRVILLGQKKEFDGKKVNQYASNHTDLRGVRCEGSNCMAWRWHPGCEPRTAGVNASGYCGLAGTTITTFD